MLVCYLPCVVEYHTLAIGHLWQHHWKMIWLRSAIGAVGGVCWLIQARRGGCLSRSHTVEPLFPDLVIDDFVVEMVSELKILSAILDAKLTFEKHVRAVIASASRRVGILRKTMSVLGDVAVVAKCFWSFILPVLDYCSPVWMSAATSHLLLLDCVIGRVSHLSGGSVSCDLWPRCKVASRSVFFKIEEFGRSPDAWSFSCTVAMRSGNQPVELWQVTLDLLRCQGLELVSFRALLFRFVFDCGMGCMNLSLLVKAWVLSF